MPIWIRTSLVAVYFVVLATLIWFVSQPVAEFWMYHTSQHWVVTTGTVDVTLVERVRARNGYAYTPHVYYRYKVNGVDYFGTRLGFGHLVYLSKSEAQAQLYPFPVDSQQIVHFDPHDPDKSVLNPNEYYGRVDSIAKIVLCGLAWVLFTATVVYAVWGGKRNDQ